MTDAVQVRPVTTPAEFKSFFEFPWVLYKDDPNWVPPLLSMRRELLDKEENPSWQYLEGEYFAAWRGDEIVGTITAFVNHRHNEYQNENIGWFGTFEVRDDAEAAAALLNTAADWVKGRGYSAIRGPQSFTQHDECGLLVQGFTRPVLLLPYNPPYYRDFIEAAGFQKVMDAYSFFSNKSDFFDLGTVGRLERLTRSIMKRNKITVRQLERKTMSADLSVFRDLYNSAWVDNWGFVPMTQQELDNLVASLGQFIEPSLVYIGEIEGEPVGFLLSVPDLYEVLYRAYARPGTPEVWTLVKALWYWKVRKVIKGVRVPFMGIKPEYRNKGVDAALYFHAFNAMVAYGAEYGESGWILEHNDGMIRIAESFGAKPDKVYRFYERTF